MMYDARMGMARNIRLPDWYLRRQEGYGWIQIKQCNAHQI